MTIAQDKAKLLEALKENHIVLGACHKTGISKSSYYRWRKSDPKFAKAADEAMRQGVDIVNDIAEGTLVGAIKEKDIDAVKFWLKHRHPEFKDHIIQAGISLSEDGGVDAILEVFKDMKPKTREMLAPYIKRNHKNNYGKNKTTFAKVAKEKV